MREPGLTAHFEITDPGGAKRTVPIWHGTFVLGADRAADVQVVAPGVRPQHLRFVPAEGIVRVEPVAAGATVEVNGEQLFCKDLVDGDVIRVGAVLIRWVDTLPQGTAAPRPVGIGEQQAGEEFQDLGTQPSRGHEAADEQRPQQDEADEDEAARVEEDGEAGDVEEVDTAGGQGASWGGMARGGS